jgi:hypothetical protein
MVNGQVWAEQQTVGQFQTKLDRGRGCVRGQHRAERRKGTVAAKDTKGMLGCGCKVQGTQRLGSHWI